MSLIGITGRTNTQGHLGLGFVFMPLPLAAKNANKLTVSVDHELGAFHTDPRLVRQVVLNLVGNACKFTKRGEVAVRARLQAQAGQDWLVFEVQDTGIGMSEAQMAKLFQEFTQVDSAISRLYGGTGLGLAISQRLCRVMHGSIEVQSEAGVGSTFTVRLPSTEPAVKCAENERGAASLRAA